LLFVVKDWSARIIAEEAYSYHHFSHMMYRAMSSPLRPRRKLLYVGVDLELLQGVQEALKDEGWLVVRCPDAGTARAFIESDIRYELLLFDMELRGVREMELVWLARSLEHRKRTPVILLLLKDSAAARMVDVTEFLWKPERFHALVETIRRLLASSGGQ
jgi:DNA-binding response OmpR family regulator